MGNFNVVAIQNHLDGFRNTLNVRNNSKTSRWFLLIRSVTRCNWFLEVKEKCFGIVQVAEERLKGDASLGQKTSLSVEDIIYLLSFASKPHNLHTTAPTINRFFGPAMDFPVFAAIAHMVMKGVEQRALATSPVKVPFPTLMQRAPRPNFL